MASRCIYCGAFSHAEEWGKHPELEKEFTENHGPGLCCSPCQYCREGIPHSVAICSGDKMDSPFVREFHQYDTITLSQIIQIFIESIESLEG